MRIAILAFPRVQLLDVAGPADVFAEAAKQLGRPRAYQVEVLAPAPGEIKSSSGVRLAVDGVAGERRTRFDTLLVAGSPGIESQAPNQRLLDWLRAESTRVRRIGSVCSGAFVLAWAGLLRGRRVTTHWNCAVRLANENPDVQVEPDSIYVRDRNLYTSAGVTAGMDLALAMVEEDHGRDLALRVARELVMFLKRPGGQSQFSAYLAAQSAERTVVGEIQNFVLANLPSDLTVPALAARANMSERNFARVFKNEAGATPAQYVERARIEAAIRILEQREVPLKKLAALVGYANADGLRRAFARRVGVSPAEYRQRFS
jgi:transcriptional regulator GlxA family with amidase domain